jgi:4-hydroxy-tetrahydrodipicolinate synthase
MQINWTGVYPALTTKFTADGRLDLATFEHNVRAQIDAGVDGLILGGSLGEASTLDDDERLDLLRCALAVSASRVPVLLNIAEGATRRATALAEAAAAVGADGFMLLPPMRYRADDREVTAFFKAVATATDRPILLYNNPVDYAIEITVPMFEELLALPTIQAVKESTRNTANVTRLRNAFGDRLKILCGVDTLALEELLLGADGWVAGLVCAFPRETVAVYRLAKAGRVDEALALYRWFMPLLELDVHPKLVQYIKLAEQMTGLGTEHVRAPRLPLVGAERERVEKIIAEGIRLNPIDSIRVD